MGTVDGFFAGPNGELDWFVQDEELDKFANVLSLSTRFCTDGHLPDDGRLLAARTRKLCRLNESAAEAGLLTTGGDVGTCGEIATSQE